MSSESKPPGFTFSPLSNTATATVDDLISCLRSTFFSSDFQNVAKTLTQREHDMKRHLKQASNAADKWKNDYLSVEKKHGELLLKHLTMEEELSRLKTECEGMKEKVIVLTEMKDVLEERDKRGEERRAKLLNEVKELDEKNRALSCSKIKAEADVEKWMNKFTEFDTRMLRLEDEASEFFSQNPMLRKEIEEEIVNGTAVQKGGSGDGGAIRVQLASGAESFSKITGSSLAGDKQPQSREIIDIVSDDEEPVRNVSTLFVNVPPQDLKLDDKNMTSESVNIEGSGQTGMENEEDSLLASNSKRKRSDVITCEQESSDDDKVPIGKRKVKSLWELDRFPQASPVLSSLDMPPVGGNNTASASPTSYNPGLGSGNADAASHPSCNPGLGPSRATEVNPSSDILGFVRRCTEKSAEKLRCPILSDSSDSSDSDDGDSDHCMDNLIASIRRQRETEKLKSVVLQ